MELPKISNSEGGVLGGLKDRLPFGKKRDEEYDDYDGYEDEDGYYDDEYDEDGYYDDEYDEGGYYDDEYDGYEDDDYDAPIGNHARKSHQSPNLVSYSDVRERGVSRGDHADWRRDRVPTASDLPDRSYAQPSTGPSFESPFQHLDTAPEYQSKGLNSLFDSTQGATAPEQPAYQVPQDQRAAVAPSASRGDSNDPYDVYAGTASRMQSPQRQLVVVRPASYNEVEQIAKALRAGDAVVLALRSTRDDLAKRVLDFSFGAASIAGARVDSIGIKTFAISTTELTDAEHRQLVQQGVL